MITINDQRLRDRRAYVLRAMHQAYEALEGRTVTQAEVARAIGITQIKVSRLMNGESSNDAGALLALAAFYTDLRI